MTLQNTSSVPEVKVPAKDEEPGQKGSAERKVSMLSAFVPIKDNISSKRSIDGTSQFLRNSVKKPEVGALSNGTLEIQGFVLPNVQNN